MPNFSENVKEFLNFTPVPESINTDISVKAAMKAAKNVA
jgi:hypothetical protein